MPQTRGRASWRELYILARRLEKWLILGVVIGLASGIAAYVFYEALVAVTNLVIFAAGLEEGGEDLGQALVEYGGTPIIVPLFMVLGAGVSSLLVYRLAPEAAGGGTEAAISAYHKNAGILPLRSGAVKGLASALVIGTGGSAGVLGPSVLIGGSIGSSIARALGLTLEDRRIALVSGMSSALAMIFHAPLGSAVFAVEVLYRRDIEANALVPAFIASVTSYTLSTQLFRYEPLITPLDVDPTLLYSAEALASFALLGVFIAPFGMFYARMFKASRILFESLVSKGLQRPLAPIVGAGLAGVLVLLAPYVAGSGKGVLSEALEGSFLSAPHGLAGATLLIMAAVFKMAATSLSVGSGGSGGVFAPGLLIGALLGLAYYEALSAVAPWLVSAEASLYAYLGMSALFAAAAKVPLATSIMVAEMGSSYLVIFPAFLSAIIAREASGSYSIYESQLDHRPPRELVTVEGLLSIVKGMASPPRVADVVNRYFMAVSVDNSAMEVLEVMRRNKQHFVPIVGKGREVLGVVTIDAIEEALEAGILESDLSAGDLPIEEAPVVSVEVSVEKALEAMIEYEVDYAIAVDDRGRYVGVVTLDDIAASLAEALIERWRKYDSYPQ